MDISKYRDEFVSEARDHLDELNDLLLVLEKDHNSTESINEIFRAFHTLKGNSAAMGFHKFSELAHALEDIMAQIRDKHLEVATNVIDLILEGCDMLEIGLEQISSDNEERISPEELIGELKQLLEEEPQSASVSIGAKVSLSEQEQEKISEHKQKGQNIYRIVLIFDKHNFLKTPKALIILRELSKIGILFKTTPEKKDIEQGKFSSEVEIILGCQKEKRDIEMIIHHITGIKHFSILGLDDTYEKPKEMLHEEKEYAKAEIINRHKEYAVGQIQSVKVSMDKLDKLMNLVGELLINNIRLQDIIKKRDFDSMKIVLNEVDRLVLDLQADVMEVRMVPIGSIFNRFPRMVRDLAKKEGKKVNLVLEGEDIEFDRTVLDKIGDPLVHLLRNSVDHGIETAEERQKIGKREEGIIKLIARREKSKAIIEVTDDGRGIDPKEVKESSIAKGIITREEAKNMSDEDLRMLIFLPGVSTNKIVTEVSGRGVGMDVVKNTVEAMRGNVTLKSRMGKGTSVVINLPLTIAIITSLLVRVNQEIYAIPLSSVNQTVDVDTSKVKTILSKKVFVLRGREIPIFWLHELLGYTWDNKDNKVTVIIVNKEGEEIGLVVDSIFSKQQILIKGFSDILKGTKGFSGATILGDGKVALIIDVMTLL
ncbi:chemotaxis protein CheA [Candidatus Woesearchaeota archaeon]|nr:chemotaxis protein CheA [Candidatus Woesearchaeota archaeon]